MGGEREINDAIFFKPFIRDVIVFSKELKEVHGLIPDCVPDGMTIDEHGFLWIAMWGAARVIR